MKAMYLGSVIFLLSLQSFAQSIEVEYDKKKDFSKYKTFTFGQSQITTPSDQKQVDDVTMNNWIVSAITEDLEQKGLKRADSLADLVITYAEGTLARTDNQVLGPLALKPGENPDRNFTFDYHQCSFIIDLNDRNGNLIWRINSTTNMTTAEAERTIDAIVQKGFKKFARPNKKKKK